MSASSRISSTHQLSESIGCSSMLSEVRVVFVLVRVLFAAHEQHVLQVMAETLCRQSAGILPMISLIETESKSPCAMQRLRKVSGA